MTTGRAGAAYPLPYRVEHLHRETADTVTMVARPEGDALPPFQPGQFAMIGAFGVGEIPVSVSAIRLSGRRLAHTVRAVGAVSGALSGVAEGAVVLMRGPFGTGWDLPSAVGRDVLVIAGGIGLAPLRPLVHEVLAESWRYGRLSVLVGARSSDDLLYRDELLALSTRAHVEVTVDRPDGGWRGRLGLVTSLLDGAGFDPPRTTAFVCGPEAMIRATARDLVHRGIPADRVRVSLERTMHCGTATCGHCQLGTVLLCRDGPVIGFDRAEPLMTVREL